jgi:hypothetical protein
MHLVDVSSAQDKISIGVNQRNPINNYESPTAPTASYLSFTYRYIPFGISLAQVYRVSKNGYVVLKPNQEAFILGQIKRKQEV